MGEIESRAHAKSSTGQTSGFDVKVRRRKESLRNTCCLGPFSSIRFSPDTPAPQALHQGFSHATDFLTNQAAWISDKDGGPRMQRLLFQLWACHYLDT